MKPKIEKRPSISLRISHRWAGMLMSLLRQEIKKRERDSNKRPFSPEPGRFNMNTMRIEACSAMLSQLESKYEPGRVGEDLVFLDRHDAEMAEKALRDQGFAEIADTIMSSIARPR